MARKTGRKTPTKSIILPHKKTLGDKACKIYELTGNKAFEWQAKLIDDIMAVNKDGLWTHDRFGISISRRNGKTEVVYMRELYGLLTGEMIMHTAHHTATTHSSWERMLELLENMGIRYTSIRATGRERIILPVYGGRIEYRSRTSKTGLGEGYDLLVVDEAQEYTDDQESALKYIVSSSRNPQIVFCGTPPTLASAGTVFKKLRTGALAGELADTGWAEWGVEEMADPHDKAAWYETNPSLGLILTERVIIAEIGTDSVDFNIQRLGHWLKYEQKSAVSEAEWMELKVAKPKLKKMLFVGVKYARSGESVSVSVAAKMEDGRTFVEGIDCRPVRDGNLWIMRFIEQAKPDAVVVDGAGAQNVLREAMRKERIRPLPLLPKVTDVIVANATFEKALYEQSICHGGQPSMTAVVSNCQKRAIGANGGFGYEAITEGCDISLMDSMILAQWACANHKERQEQQVWY